MDRAGPPDVERPEDEVEYLRRTPLSRRRGLRRRSKEEKARYIDTGAPSFRGPGEENVAYVRRARMHRPWWRRPLIVIPLVLVILIAAGGTFVLTQRNVTTEVSLEKVVKRFEAQEPEITKDRGIEELDATRSTGSAVSESQPEDTTPTASKKGGAQVDDAPDPYVLPAEGVYLYKTRGGEQVSVFGASHTYPERTYTTVRHTGGCRWEQRIDVIEEHVDIRKVCSRPDELLQIAQARYVTFFGQQKGDENVCEPWASFHALEERKGSRATATCRGEQGEAQLVRVFEGVEPYVIEGEIEQVVKVRIDATFTGKTEGESTDLLWLSRRTGFPLRWDRTVDAISSEFGTDVRYTEEASFELVSLEPQR